MAEQCFVKKESAPPVCGVHNVPLVHKLLPQELIASGHKVVTFLASPESGVALDEEEKQKLALGLSKA